MLDEKVTPSQEAARKSKDFLDGIKSGKNLKNSYLQPQYPEDAITLELLIQEESRERALLDTSAQALNACIKGEPIDVGDKTLGTCTTTGSIFYDKDTHELIPNYPGVPEDQNIRIPVPLTMELLSGALPLLGLSSGSIRLVKDSLAIAQEENDTEAIERLEKELKSSQTGFDSLTVQSRRLNKCLGGVDPVVAPTNPPKNDTTTPKKLDDLTIGLIASGVIAVMLGILAAAAPLILPLLPVQLRALLPF